jgi:glycosyltransferase involved in cell wall biosynthesis
MAVINMQPFEGVNQLHVPTAAPAVSWLLCSNVANEQLRLAIQSCLDQTFQSFELLVIANGDSAHVVASEVKRWFGNDPRIRILVTQVRQLPFSLSLGLHHARGALIARMDGDDLSHPSRLQQQVDFMRSHPDVGVLGTAYEIIDSAANILGQVHMPFDNVNIRRCMHLRNPICHPSVMYRRDIILKAGGYIGGLHAEDFDLWVRLSADERLQFANLSNVCLSYRSIGVGQARGARGAYASVAGTQLRAFLAGQGSRWLVGVFITMGKMLLRFSPLQKIFSL